MHNSGTMAEHNPEILIRAQTPEEELDRIQFYLRKLDCYRKLGYKPIFPNDAAFSKPCTNEDKSEKLQILLSEYKPEIYEAGVCRLVTVKAKIKATFPIFLKLRETWGFIVFPKYEIAITRYGMGGSYDIKTGKITVRINDKAEFLRVGPEHTTIHEMVHLGIQERIVEKYQLNQTEKERLVDTMVSNLFGGLLPTYKLQSVGDVRVDPYITTETIIDLPKAIEDYVTKYPR